MMNTSERNSASEWKIELGTPPGPIVRLSPEEMKNFSVHGMDHGIIIECWRGHARYGTNFEVKITSRPLGNGLTARRLSYSGYEGDDQVEVILFPIVREKLTEGTAFLEGCRGLGMILHTPYLRLLTEERPGRYRNDVTHLNAILHPDSSGTYLDIRDEENLSFREFEVHTSKNQDQLVFIARHYQALGKTPCREWNMACDCVTGPFQGSWYEAAQIYRDWVLNQWWVRRAKENPQAASLRGIGLWFWNRGRAETVLPPVFKVREELPDVPLALDWYWWHSCPYDTDYPNYWPPREGAEFFADCVRECRDKNIFVQCYMNGVHWSMESKNWESDGKEGAVLLRNGKIKNYEANHYTHHHLAWQCGEAVKFQNFFCEQVRNLSQCGVSGQYMDVIANYSNTPCYNPAHRHAPGAGSFAAGGLRSFIQRVKKENPNLAVTSEECSERFMDLLDGVITLETSCERFGNADNRTLVPLFQAIYHGETPTMAVFGNYALPDGIPPFDELWPKVDRWKEEKPWHRLFPDQFPVEYGRAIIWGIQPTVCNMTEKICSDPEFADIYRFILAGARFHHDNLDFLFDGRMLSPAGFQCGRRKVQFMLRGIFTREENLKIATEDLPAVIHCLWRSPAGKCSLFMVNYTSEPQQWGYKNRKGIIPPLTFQRIDLAVGQLEDLPVDR